MSSPGGAALELDGPVGICRIASPGTRNALSPALMGAVLAGLESHDANEAVRCIVLAGSDEVFATGADISSLGAGGIDADAAERWRRVAAIEKPVVAATSGWALGPGFELALCCDLIVASRTTRFGVPEVALGMVPGGGATQRLARTIGKHLTMELILTGRRMSAEQAHGYGLVATVADKKRWLAEAIDLARQVAERGPVATRLAKRAVLDAERRHLDDALAEERRLHDQAMGTEDRVEGVQAFVEGRPPRFEGR